MTPEQFKNGGKSKGIPASAFLAGGDFTIWKPEEKPSFFQGIKQDFNTRVDQASDAQMQALNGERSDASAAGRTIGAGFRFIGDINARALSAVTPDPIGDMAIKSVQALAGSKAGQAVASTYGDLKSKYPETVEGVEDASSVIGGLLAPGVANTTAKAGLSVAARSAEALGGITAKGAQGIKLAASKAIDPPAIMQRVARISKPKQAAFQKMAGESVGEFLVKREIFGDIDEITEQLYTRFEKSKGEVDKAYDKLPGEYKNTALGSALKELAAREQRVSSPGAISRDLERVTALLKKHNGAGLDMSEINEVKRLYERNVKLDYVKENVPDKIERAKNLDSAIRTWQQNQASQLGFKNVEELNRETMLNRQLLDDLGAEYAGSAGNNAITITDWIMLSGGDPTAVGGFLAKKALSSKGVMSKVAKIFTKRDGIGQPKAQMAAPTIDNYLNWIKKTTQPTIDIDTPIKDYVNKSQPGLSIKSTVPAPQNIAKEITAGQYKRIREYLALKAEGISKTDVTTEIDIDDLMDDLGIQKVALPEKGKAPAPAFSDEQSMYDYLQAVAEAYDAL